MSILDDIYDAVGDDAALARLPAALAREAGARSCVIQLFSAHDELVDHRFSYFSAPLFEHYVDNGFYKIDVWKEIGTRPGVLDQVFNCDDILDVKEVRRSPFYNEVFRSQGDDTARCLGGCFRIDHHLLTLGLHRASSAASFGADESGRIRSLVDHLRRLYVARQVLDRANARADQLAVALDVPLIGIIRVNLRGQLVHVNAAAQDILRQHDGFVLIGQTVAVQAQALQSRFVEAVRTAALRSGGQGGALLVPRPSGKPSWRLIVAPDEAHASGCATLLIESADQEGGLRARLATLYELTRAESEVAVLLAEGLSPAEIAERRMVSIDTIRNQIKSLLQKTGTRRLGALIALTASVIRTR